LSAAPTARSTLAALAALLLSLPSAAVACHGDAHPVARDAAGRIQRDRAAVREFRRLHPCPATGRTAGACPGWEIDHIRPLHQGGADAPCNLQWLTEAAHRAKTAAERRR
jgi:5-methylcytosine-specific restriction endonuclease McrA